MTRKVVISDKGSKATAFFADLARRKDETRKRLEAKTASIRERLLKPKPVN